ncbi:MAG: ORF6N domain-containing protein [Paludibacter sp.]|nr:ORF6N domain-containing protein [Paludibacter sp.]
MLPIFTAYYISKPNNMNLQLIQNKIITLRDQQVILDSDVAELYGVETKRVNEAVSNNPDKFPAGYILDLTSEEWKNLKSKNSTSSWGGKRKLPKTFTEKGLYMLATILKSPVATETTLAIIETFAKIRELSRNLVEMQLQPDKEKQKSILQKSGNLISDILHNDFETVETETTYEMNLFAFGIKHTVKKKSKQDNHF